MRGHETGGEREAKRSLAPTGPCASPLPARAYNRN